MLEEIPATAKQPSLKDILTNGPPTEVATLINEAPDDDKKRLFKLLSPERAVRTFEYLTFGSQYLLLKSFNVEKVAHILNQIAPDDRTTLFEQLPEGLMQEWLSLLSDEERKTARFLLQYPESSIGRLMTPDLVSVKPDWTVQQALDYIRQYGKNSETLNSIYVTDDQGKLIDDIRVREFLLAPLDKKVRDLMDNRFVALDARQDQEKAIPIFRRENRVALPVVDYGGLLLGIVTVDDIVDVLEEETTEDIQKLGGSEALDEPYLTIALPKMIRKRVGWLIVLFIGEMLTATAMGYFEDEISKAVVLALFVPLIISSGGNSGSQAATLITRALALGEVTLAKWWLVLQRELVAGLVMGVILGIIGFLRITIWSLFSTIYGQHWLLIAFTVGFSLIGVVVWGTLSGSLLPLLLKRLNFDPAASSAPFVATLVDVTGLVIYFSVAFIVLRGTLL